jgi:predicted metalloendopeptidase
MKMNFRPWMLAAILIIGTASVSTSCKEEEINKPTVIDPDPYPDEYLDNKDLSVKPGDSFFDYCNGTWLAKNPIPTDPEKNLGGLYEATDVMNDRVEQLKSSVPDIGQFFSLMDHMYDKSANSRAYIAAQKSKIQKPVTKEEAYRAIGKMYREGVNALDFSFFGIWDKDKLKAVILPESSNKTTEAMAIRLQEQNRTPLMQTRAAGETSIPVLLAEGIGLDPSLLMIEKSEIDVWKKLWDQFSVDDLYQKMQDAWLEYEAYADAAGLAAYNATLPAEKRYSEERLRFSARAELGYTLSYHLQQKFVPQSLKDKYLGITKEIQEALRYRLEEVDWMSETTKQNAIDKLDNYGLNVAFPDKWYTDCIPTLADCTTMVEALQRVRACNVRLKTKLMGTADVFSNYLTQTANDSNGHPVSLDLTLANATYSAQYNCVTIYPAMLLPPVMPEEGLTEACYYAVFAIIAHEFTHGFDSNGSQWNKYGQKQNWWTVADKMAFEDRKENLIRTYNSMELDPKRAPLVFCNGERTQNENIADLGGFLTALDAYKAVIDEQGFRGERRREQLRKFYESYAHLWCIQYGQKKFDILCNSDVHAHARLRVNGVVMNTDSWYNIYDVDRNNLLYLPKERRAYIW